VIGGRECDRPSFVGRGNESWFDFSGIQFETSRLQTRAAEF